MLQTVQNKGTGGSSVKIGTWVNGVAVAKASAAFIFSGQGSQYVGMGRALFRTEPTFRDELLRMETHWFDARTDIDTLLANTEKAKAGLSVPSSLIGDVLRYTDEAESARTVGDPGKGLRNGDAHIHNTRYAQPALLALEWALARLLQSLGVQPKASC